MGHHDDGLALERRPDDVLDQAVRVLVNVGGGLVHHEDLGPPQHGPGEAEKLPLPHLVIRADGGRGEVVEINRVVRDSREGISLHSNRGA